MDMVEQPRSHSTGYFSYKSSSYQPTPTPTITVTTRRDDEGTTEADGSDPSQVHVKKSMQKPLLTPEHCSNRSMHHSPLPKCAASSK